MVYSANLFYLTMRVHWEQFFDGARTCARAARISSTSNEMLFLKDFWHWLAIWARSARASARQEISTNKWMRFALWIIVVTLKLVKIEHVKVLKFLVKKRDFLPPRLFLTASFVRHDATCDLKILNKRYIRPCATFSKNLSLCTMGMGGGKFWVKSWFSDVTTNFRFGRTYIL